MPFRDGHRSSIRNSAQIVAEKVANWLFKDGGAKFMLKRWQNLRGNCQKNVIVSAVNRDNIFDTAKQICTRQICIFFRFSEVIRQFVWLILCLVGVTKPFLNLKLHLCHITLRIYRNQNKNNFAFSVQFTNLTKHGKEHSCASEILKKIWICLAFIQL